MDKTENSINEKGDFLSSNIDENLINNLISFLKHKFNVSDVIINDIKTCKTYDDLGNVIDYHNHLIVDYLGIEDYSNDLEDEISYLEDRINELEDEIDNLKDIVKI